VREVDEKGRRTKARDPAIRHKGSPGFRW
jgi:hypothetical protein